MSDAGDFTPTQGPWPGLCAVCSRLQIPETSAPGLVTHPHHRTWEEFSDAAKHGCYICSKIWRRLKCPTDGPGSHEKPWTPMRYWIQKDSTNPALNKLNVVYTAPVSGNVSREIFQFRVMPYKEGDLCHGNEIGTLTSDDSVLKRALGWFQACHVGHARCSRYYTEAEKWHPTRLIDLGTGGSSIWKLHCLADDGPLPSKASYIALSYRWSANPGLLLLSSTLQEFRRGKPLGILPKTFQELAIVARQFSIRYIWIDALCIIQDSDQDWKNEALKMRQVYANAACTVAATASADENGGLFRARDPRSILPAIARLNTSSSRRQTVCIFERDYWDQHILTGPLHKRGWVFQERHLSPRVLYFGSTQVLWECFHEAKCEVFLHGVPFHWSDKNLSGLWDLLDKKDIPTKDSRDLMPMSAYIHWRDLVKNYSQCSLTKSEDKLPAFAGLAKLFQEATGDDYLAGLWRSKLLEGLDWRVSEPQNKPAVYRAPSWSWASIDGPVRPELPGAMFKHLAEVVEAHIQPQGSDPTGCISGGHLTLRGFVTEGQVQGVEQGGEYDVKIPPAGVEAIQLRLFSNHLNISLRDGQTLAFLPLNSTLFPSQGEMKPQVVFIILVPAREYPQTRYRRIGHFVLQEYGKLEQFGLQRQKEGLMILSQERMVSLVTIV